jgi:hypothetical protein
LRKSADWPVYVPVSRHLYDVVLNVTLSLVSLSSGSALAGQAKYEYLPVPGGRSDMWPLL